MLKISELYIYPIKSLGGIQLSSAEVTDRGFKHDRRWMLIDADNRFISQREVAAMAAININIEDAGLRVSAKDSFIIVPFLPETENFIDVTVWDDVCTAQLVDKKIDEWFCNILGINCRLVYMPDASLRKTDANYSPEGHFTSFSDGYPFLIIGQASLDDLNGRLPDPLPINRFRPNIVFTGGEPYQEDAIDEFTINSIHFNGVKLCARCKITTIDQTNATAGKEPLKTLAGYRAKNNKIYFGQNLIHSGSGQISVGDELKITSFHHNERFIIAKK